MSVITLFPFLARLRTRPVEQHPAGEVHPAGLQSIRERRFQRLGVGGAVRSLRVAFPGFAHIGYCRIESGLICQQVMGDQKRVRALDAFEVVEDADPVVEMWDDRERVIAGCEDEVEGEHDLLIQQQRQELDIGFDLQKLPECESQLLK